MASPLPQLGRLVLVSVSATQLSRIAPIRRANTSTARLGMRIQIRAKLGGVSESVTITKLVSSAQLLHRPTWIQLCGRTSVAGMNSMANLQLCHKNLDM